MLDPPLSVEGRVAVGCDRMQQLLRMVPIGLPARGSQGAPLSRSPVELRGLCRKSCWTESAHRREPTQRGVTRHHGIPHDVNHHALPDLPRACGIRGVRPGVIRDVAEQKQ